MNKYISKEDFIINEIKKRQKKIDDNVRLFELEVITKLKDSTIDRLLYEIDLLKAILSILIKEKNS